MTDHAETYYDSADANAFYRLIWGGEDVHVGLYHGARSIRDASAATVDHMAAALPALGEDTWVLDAGAGYGGSMRRLVTRFGCRATCLNISETQNNANRAMTRQADLAHRIDVLHGSFEDIPAPDGRYDVVWSQDAILHSGRRRQVLAEVFRVLKPGGHFIFTDPMQADDVPDGVLQPVLDRLQLTSLGSMRFYREAATALGFQVLRQEFRTADLRTHYARVRQEMLANRVRLRAEGASAAYLDRMAVGLDHWVAAADAGHLVWGLQLFARPA